MILSFCLILACFVKQLWTAYDFTLCSGLHMLLDCSEFC
jgi:hypothetical protein